MNKYQEAFNEIISALKIDNLDMGESAYNCIDQESVELIQELVYKAIPMKAIKIPATHSKYNAVAFGCPKCLIQTQFIKKYCGNCGQAILWEE